MTSDGSGGEGGDRFHRRARPDTESTSSAAGQQYRLATGETIEQTLDIERWDPAERMAERIGHLQAAIEEALAREEITRGTLRAEFLPQLKTRLGAPKGAGHSSVTMNELRFVQRSVLFSGHLEAVDGTSVVHETLPITVVQTGVVLVSYLGQNGSWGSQVFQRDVRLMGSNRFDAAMDLLEKRHRQDDNEQEAVSDMLRRAMMMYAELAVLGTKATKSWRLGHGNPLSKELLTGSGMPEITELALPIMRTLFLDHKRFVYVPSGTGDRAIRTFASALYPLEYAIIADMDEYLAGIIDKGHYGAGRFRAVKTQLDEFRKDAARDIVIGAFRVSPHAPAQVFFAHASHAAEAALVAMANSLLVETRGFPMLLDYAGHLCRGLFPADAVLRPAAAVFERVARGAGMADPDQDERY